jgi:hypothetical protein
MVRRSFGVACAASVLFVFACSRAETPPERTTQRPLGTTSLAQAPAPAAQPTRLIELATSAYPTSLALDGEAIYLLSPDAAYRLVPGEPPRRLEIALGFAATLTRSAFVHWSEGKLLSTPKSGGPSKVLARVSTPPQALVASGEAFAWVTRDDAGSYTLVTVEGNEPRVLFASRGELSALHLIDSSLYFLERPVEADWRVGVVPLGGGEPRFRPTRRGRRPALLTGTDAIFYYDVDAFQIRRLTLDLRDDEPVMSKVVCTPLAAAADVYCASVEGLFVVAPSTGTPSILSAGRAGTITFVVADARWVAWTVDLGPNRLGIDLLPAVTPR